MQIGNLARESSRCGRSSYSQQEVSEMLKVYAASSDAAMHTAIELALKTRASPVELDQHLYSFSSGDWKHGYRQ
ncbi:hypothetical protein [Massilia scottii]|uniref:hypothetical protein n=1 Tax=Massilia scottii TaxID=3057166 RepID=UPI002796DF81|nr:hypothetical protein [Massilia sp. CCM 9029]MDQ1830499.1 hypothetical protein [Massilia sp. CCM 9029]